MNPTTGEANLLELVAENQAARQVLDKYGISWLVDMTDLAHGDELVGNAAAIAGVTPAALCDELILALDHTSMWLMTRRLPWRDAAAR